MPHLRFQHSHIKEWHWKHANALRKFSLRIESAGCPNAFCFKIEEVQGVVQVLDQEEEIAVKEFAKFEEKLKELRGSRVGAPGNG